jgi:hypothetical protein
LIDTLLNLVFRCAHRRLTRPVTPVKKGDAPHSGTYVVCLECGKQFAYDTKQMRLGKPIAPTHERSLVQEGGQSTAGRVKEALMAIVPAIAVFFLALFGIKQRPKR